MCLAGQSKHDSAHPVHARGDPSSKFISAAIFVSQLTPISFSRVIIILGFIVFRLVVRILVLCHPSDVPCYTRGGYEIRREV